MKMRIAIRMTMMMLLMKMMGPTPTSITIIIKSNAITIMKTMATRAMSMARHLTLFELKLDFEIPASV